MDVVDGTMISIVLLYMDAMKRLGSKAVLEMSSAVPLMNFLLCTY